MVLSLIYCSELGKIETCYYFTKDTCVDIDLNFEKVKDTWNENLITIFVTNFEFCHRL